MCNAWNHPPQCACGWGGEGHLGKRPAGYANNQSNEWSKYLSFTGVSSYLNPNARCPVCRAPVFFYQSPEGGRVFFDELGPPWPKHGCTDNSQNKTFYVEPLSITSPTGKVYSWQHLGWMPFIVDEVKLQPPFFLISFINGTIGEGESLSIYVNAKLGVRAPYFVKLISEGVWKISTLETDIIGSLTIGSVKFRPVELYGYKSMFALSKHVHLTAPSRRGPRKSLVTQKELKKMMLKKTTDKPKPTKLAKKKGSVEAVNTNKKEQKAIVVNENQKPKPTALTALQIAYEKAKNK